MKNEIECAGCMYKQVPSHFVPCLGCKNNMSSTETSNPTTTTIHNYDLKQAIEEFSEFLYKTSVILIVNPEDVKLLNLNELPDYCYLVSVPHIEKGTTLLIKDSPLKKQLYDFCCEYPERIFRGRKGRF